MEQEFRRKTVGLVTADDFRRAREESLSAAEKLRAAQQNDVEQTEQKLQDIKRQQKEAKRKKISASLSFNLDDLTDDCAEESFSFKKKSKTSLATESGGDGVTVKSLVEEEDKEAFTRTKIKKNPFVDTSFLPDRERDRKLEQEKEALRKEWLQEQEVIKNEVRECVYYLSIVL